jgi:hypothetical protein
MSVIVGELLNAVISGFEICGAGSGKEGGKWNDVIEAGASSPATSRSCFLPRRHQRGRNSREKISTMPPTTPPATGPAIERLPTANGIGTIVADAKFIGLQNQIHH